MQFTYFSYKAASTKAFKDFVTAQELYNILIKQIYFLPHA